MTTITSPAKTSEKQGKVDAATTAAKAPTKKRPFAAARQGIKAGLPVVVWATVIRVATLVVDYLLVMVTAVGIIPMIGLYLHQASGAAQNELTTSGTVALWVVPLLFVVTLLAVAEAALMRWLWRAGNRRIASIREHHAARKTTGK
ncbi:hypothetical protein [Arthrobacter bambusae]|uniref:Uncharacterized protein n=1 Tax=Arthrobacter bambusae TaxID=1338426 RepID=A0AAW8DFV1_9MICC|nr:hypothetical protein [Arthrobacter bambusae]MDP9904776.1 hypothetical protein [Arthrobacter bambusae]MDQ0129592.1 hypothetical protein [Arthrobacter bambusae]MDQ0180795.1 hypothetical protein [Arthrobacter bambusae]